VIYFIRNYQTQDQDSVIQLYKEVFAEPPWNEYRKCKRCGINYSIDEIGTSKWYDEGCGLVREKEYEFLIPSRNTTKKCESCGSDLEKVVCKKCGIDMKVRTSRYWAGTRYYTNENLVEYWSYDDVLKDIEYCQKQKNPIFLVAEIEPKTSEKIESWSGRIVGFTWGYELPIQKFPFLSKLVDKKSIYIDELAVKKEYRRKGIGKALTNSLIEDAKNLLYESVVLRTNINSIAYLFYLALGFTDMGIRDPKYSERTYMKKLV
jgi:ribosomal protein S18 acetylase RimI-like enzyme